MSSQTKAYQGHKPAYAVSNDATDNPQEATGTLKLASMTLEWRAVRKPDGSLLPETVEISEWSMPHMSCPQCRDIWDVIVCALEASEGMTIERIIADKAGKGAA